MLFNSFVVHLAVGTFGDDATDGIASPQNVKSFSDAMENVIDTQMSQFFVLMSNQGVSPFISGWQNGRKSHFIRQVFGLA